MNPGHSWLSQRLSLATSLMDRECSLLMQQYLTLVVRRAYYVLKVMCRCPPPSVCAECRGTTDISSPPIRPHHGRAHQLTLVTSAGKDCVQGRRADLPGTARWCSSVPAAVYTSRRHPVPTKTSVFHLGRSVFLPSDCLLLDVVLSLSLALVFGTLFLPTSLQHLLCSLSENV